MTDTRFIRTASGTIIQMDVPESGNRREVFDSQVARGDLLVVTGEVEEYTTRQGGKAWRLVSDEEFGNLGRALLEARAEAVGLEVDGRWSDKTLALRVQYAEEAAMFEEPDGEQAEAEA